MKGAVYYKFTSETRMYSPRHKLSIVIFVNDCLTLFIILLLLVIVLENYIKTLQL